MTTFQNVIEESVEKGLGDNETWNYQQNEVEVHLPTLWADAAGVRQARGLACTKPRALTEDTYDLQAPQGCPGQPRDGQLVPRQSGRIHAAKDGKCLVGGANAVSERPRERTPRANARLVGRRERRERTPARANATSERPQAPDLSSFGAPEGAAWGGGRINQTVSHQLTRPEADII